MIAITDAYEIWELNLIWKGNMKGTQTGLLLMDYI